MINIPEVPLHLKTKPWLLPLYIAIHRYIESSVKPEDAMRATEWVRKFSNNTDIDPMNWVVSHIMALEKQIRELEKRPAEYIPE